MQIQLKPLDQQVIVITGASSGIGLVTARMAARQGAAVVLAARDEETLRETVAEIERDGGRATFVVADVAEPDAGAQIANAAIQAFGGFDTWVNNAGVTIFGEIWKVPVADARRLFEVNYWGMVYGCLVAAEHLRHKGGAIINIGSVLSDRAMPLQGHYSASKHAVKGFTEALRMELEREEAPVAVTLVKPTSTATPYPEHAQNYMDEEPTLPAPIYAPEVVAETILECARRPVRHVSVGVASRMLSGMGRALPRVTDRVLEATAFDQQKRDEPRGDGGGRASNLYAPVRGDGRERGQYDAHVMESSLYTKAVLNPWKSTLTAAVALGLGLALAGRLR
jgi:short-subunit dehydrogenase